MIEFAIAAIPLLLLLVALLLGHYPGCEVAVRLAERIASRLRTKVAAVVSPLRRRPRHAAQGGLLLACSLSSRGPPA